MTILIATGIYPPESGGPATYSWLLRERLPALGIAVRVLPFRTVRHLPPLIRHIAYFFAALWQARGVDVIYAQDTVSVGLPAALAALLAGKKFMVRVPGDYAWEQGRQRFGITDELDGFQDKRYGLRVELLRALQQFVVRCADAVVVPSDYMKRIVSAWGSSGKVHRIYSSIELPLPFEMPHERPEGFLVLSFGRQVPWKGFEALRRVVGTEPGWQLKIFSEVPYPQAMGWLKAADVYVNNSTYEGLSHQLVEAMALGTPIVATRVGGNPELIEDGISGLLIPPKDDYALHTALKKVHDDREAARERARRAGVKVQEFSIDTAIQKVAALIQQI